MSNKGFITPLDTGLTEDSTYPNWVKIRPYGNKKRCRELKIKARGLLQKLIDDSKRLGLEHEVNQRRHPQSDGSLIIVHYHYENPVIDIFAPSGKGEKPRASLFQCDLYQDHADTPADLDTQTITPIYFNVVDIPYWKEIPERQGNMEWRGDAGMVSYDCTQNWGNAILNKRAWNDGIYGPHGEDVGWPYDPRPEHAKRRGEISTIVNNYPDVNVELSDRELFQLNYKAVFEPDEQVHKQHLFINGTRYDINFPFSNQLIMGACLSEDSICVVVTQVFGNSPGIDGIALGYEDVWYFNLSDGVNPTPIKAHTMYYTNPQEFNYISNKSDITSWAFNKEGTIGKAVRSQQYFVDNLLYWGPYHEIRFIDMTINYTPLSASIEHTEDTGIIPAASNIVPGGADMSSGEIEEWQVSMDEWMEDLFVKTKLANFTDRYFGVLDIEMIWAKDNDSGSTEIVEQYKCFGHSNRSTVTGVNTDPFQQCAINSQVSCNDVLISEWEFEGSFTRVENPVPSGTSYTTTASTTNPQGMMYVGGSPKHNIAFFVKITVPSVDGENIYTMIRHSSAGDDRCSDFPYTVHVQLVCVFKGTEVDVGSPIIYDVPYHADTEQNNASSPTSAPSPLRSQSVDSYFTGVESVFSLSSTAGYSKSTNWFQCAIPADGAAESGDFGGSIKCAPDGSHVVVSCSYMDLAKYIYPWHRHIFDLNETSKIDRLDSMDALGVDAELQTAWNKYMINYAIIGPIPEEDDGTGSPTWALDGISLGGTGGASPTIAGIGSTSSSSTFEGTGLEVRVEQMSRLLFNKKVTEDLLGGPSDNHSDYEFGIKEKDTNAFLPIGLYAFPSNEE